jgi:NADH:ubiquinone oxidoreductase subunit 6 (subunit J)
METKIVQPWMKGLILSLVLIFLSIVLYFTNQSQNKVWGWLQSAIIMGAIIWSCIYYAKQMDGNVSFGNIFAHGFKMTAAMIVIFCIYTVISIKFLFPEMLDKIMEQAALEADKRGGASEEQIKAGLDMFRKFFMPITIGSIMLMFAFLGAISSAIGAGVAKKNPNATPFDQQ